LPRPCASVGLRICAALVAADTPQRGVEPLCDAVADVVLVSPDEQLVVFAEIDQRRALVGQAERDPPDLAGIFPRPSTKSSTLTCTTAAACSRRGEPANWAAIADDWEGGDKGPLLAAAKP
jgi:hypothetical protein